MQPLRQRPRLRQLQLLVAHRYLAVPHSNSRPAAFSDQRPSRSPRLRLVQLRHPVEVCSRTWAKTNRLNRRPQRRLAAVPRSQCLGKHQLHRQGRHKARRRLHSSKHLHPGPTLLQSQLSRLSAPLVPLSHLQLLLRQLVLRSSLLSLPLAVPPRPPLLHLPLQLLRLGLTCSVALSPLRLRLRVLRPPQLLPPNLGRRLAGYLENLPRLRHQLSHRALQLRLLQVQHQRPPQLQDQAHRRLLLPGQLQALQLEGLISGRRQPDPHRQRSRA